MIINSEQLAIEMARALDSKKAQNIRIFDVRGLSSVTEFYIVATGTSAPHLNSLVEETRSHLKKLGVTLYRTSGEPDSGWVVADYVHAVVHVFSTEARDYYAIEKLWTTAKEIPLPEN